MISYWLWKTRCSEEWLSLDSSNWFSERSVSAVLLFSGVLSFIYLKTFLLFFLKRLLAENICYVACSSRKHSCWLHFNTMKMNHELMVIVNLSTESHIFRQCGYFSQNSNTVRQLVKHIQKQARRICFSLFQAAILNTVTCGRVIQSNSQLTNMQKCIFWTVN